MTGLDILYYFYFKLHYFNIDQFTLNDYTPSFTVTMLTSSMFINIHYLPNNKLFIYKADKKK